MPDPYTSKCIHSTWSLVGETKTWIEKTERKKNHFVKHVLLYLKSTKEILYPMFVLRKHKT